MKKWTPLLVIVGVLVLIGVVLGSMYNSIVANEQKVEKEASNIEVVLQRRADLIPNLVSTVKGYASHEEEIINKVVEARTKLVGAKDLEEKAKANDELTTSLNALMVIVENYPDLKANQNFIQLADELAGTENRIAVARRDYNEAVTNYNTQIKKFPTNIIAGMFGFEKKALFESAEGANEVPKVDFE